MQNFLKNETSPYLLQHADNPVNWYPWCEEAFKRAREEDKPIFLSIGYSTCHWCHVMAHESFEDEEIAKILNEHYISIKVDKEERPDIDSIYMSACQALTGRGGWPTSIFMTPEQRPFFAGTYFPKNSRFGQRGFGELLLLISEKWEKERNLLLTAAERVVQSLNTVDKTLLSNPLKEDNQESYTKLIEEAYIQYNQSFDRVSGGFGRAPKFPMPHQLLFLLRYYERTKDKEALSMAKLTLDQMYRGGIFDHIGGGFSRYSTDERFLVPHFEKMLYDNALLIMAYSKLYQVTKKPIYCHIAKKTADYVLREMTAKEGGFYSAQDADSEGVEGKYYLFHPEEILKVCGIEEGEEFNKIYDITKEGNFEGQNIPNLLNEDEWENKGEFSFGDEKKKLYDYRKNRYRLHLDDKILTSWNGLMITAMCHLYRVSGERKYLDAAKKAWNFIEKAMGEEELLCVSFREGKRGGKGFLDDYANIILSLLALYESTYESEYLIRAKKYCRKAIDDFYDEKEGGFFLYGRENETLIIRPKETYDGAVFSGNSSMAVNLVKLSYLTKEKIFAEKAKEQLTFLAAKAEKHPAAHGMFLTSLLDGDGMQTKVTVVLKEKKDVMDLPVQIPLDVQVIILEEETKEYPLLQNKTTFYLCHENACLPPSSVPDFS